MAVNLKGKTIAFCLPGRTYSGKFLVSFTQLTMAVIRAGAAFMLVQEYDACVNFARCKCLGADAMAGKFQKPLKGLPYDYIMWIDSDQVFTPEDFFKLVEADKDIVSGWYVQPWGEPDDQFTSVTAAMATDTTPQDVMTVSEIVAKPGLFHVPYMGLGWTLMKRGVFEKLEYPWFAPKLQKIMGGQDMCSEDVAFCMDAIAAGFDLWVDPTCRVGHEKMLII